MIPVAQAEQIIWGLVQPFQASSLAETAVVGLDAAYDRILAVPVTSNLDVPHWHNSAMDGYAVRFADVCQASQDDPRVLTLVEDIPAGQVPRCRIEAGQAARILTGAMMPDGADTIVMQEHTHRDGETVAIVVAPPQSGAFVRHRGAFYQAGDPLLPSGILLGAPELAILAATQCTQVTVYRRPRVAILSTGSELVAPDQPLHPGQIVDSNQIALAALVRQAGGEPICFGIIPDQADVLKAAIVQAATMADVILSSGGVSVGDHDHVDQTLAEVGATLHVRSVAIKPGKPLTVAMLRSRNGSPDDAEHGVIPLHESPPPPSRPVLYFGLPGNPVSALVTFWRFVQPAIKKLGGRSPDWQPQFLSGITTQPLKAEKTRETYIWGRSQLIDGHYHFYPAGGSHSSGNLINLTQTNALAIVPVGHAQVEAGNSIQLLPLSG